MKNKEFKQLAAIPLVGKFRDAYAELRRSAMAWQEVISERPDREDLQRAHDRVFQRLTEEDQAVSPAGLQRPKKIEPLLRPSGKVMGKQKREAKDG